MTYNLFWKNSNLNSLFINRFIYCTKHQRNPFLYGSMVFQCLTFSHWLHMGNTKLDQYSESLEARRTHPLSAFDADLKALAWAFSPLNSSKQIISLALLTVVHRGTVSFFWKCYEYTSREGFTQPNRRKIFAPLGRSGLKCTRRSNPSSRVFLFSASVSSLLNHWKIIVGIVIIVIVVFVVFVVVRNGVWETSFVIITPLGRVMSFRRWKYNRPR